MERPKYYFAMFGDPDPPKKDKVESDVPFRNKRYRYTG